MNPASSVFSLLLVASVLLYRADQVLGNDGSQRLQKRDIPQQKTYRVATILNPPYTMQDEDQKLIGFIPDLMQAISEIAGFSYRFIIHTRYGSLRPDNSWNGMIGALIPSENGSTEVDIAAAPLTVTSMLRMVVDFPHPFHDLGLTILIKKPHYNVKTDTFSTLDLDPFGFTVLSSLSAEVWGLMMASVVGVSLALWMINKFNPYEWEGRYKLGLASEEDSEAFGLASSLWFVSATLQWQGFDKAPRSWAGKTLSVFWFSFVTIVLVTFTAGIVNSLFFASVLHQQDALFDRIHSLAELINHPHGYTYGAVSGGATHAYLTQVARGREFDVIRKHIASDEGQKDLVASMSEGLAKVRTQKYAFIIESMSAKFETNERPCDLMTVGEVFAKRNFGMAVPKGAEVLENLDKAVITLRESGRMKTLEDEWFTGKGQCWNLTVAETLMRKERSMDLNKPKKVDMRMFWGPFVILLAGLVVSSLVCVAEVLWYKRERSTCASTPPY